MGAIFIQAIGWVTMIPDQYEKTGSISTAVDNTFSGNYPCEFCKAAQRMSAAELPATNEEERQPLQAGAKKLLSASLDSLFVPKAHRSFIERRKLTSELFGGIDIEPESPPPRLV